MSGFKQRIGDLLIAQRLVTQEKLDDVMAESSRCGKSFARLLIDCEILSEATLTELLSKELGLPMISLTKYRLDPAVIRLIPERIARQYNLIALAKFGDRLVVAMSDPLNVFAIDDLKALTQVAIDLVLSPEVDIRRAIEQTYTSQESVTEAAPPESEADDGNLDTAVALMLNESGNTEGPVVQVINLMVIEAMRRHASDIHLEPMENALRVRYRIDGRLIETHRLPKPVQNPVLTRLKIMSGLDITE